MKRAFQVLSAAAALFVAAAVFFAPAVSCGAAFLLDGVAAEVGGERITVSDVMSEVRDMSFGMSPRPGVRELYASALTNLVGRRLILRKYERSPLKLPAWYLKRRPEAIVSGEFGGDKARLAKALDSRGVGYDAWLEKTEADAIIGAMRAQFVDRGLSVGPGRLREAYERDYAGKKLAGPVRVAMILLEFGEGATNAAAAAAHLASRLRSGELDFATVARRVSSGPRAAAGGDWGYIDPGEELRADLAAAIGALGVGETGGPIDIGGGRFYIVRKLDERPDLAVPYGYVREKIEGELRAKAAAERFGKWVESLADETTVRVFPSPFGRPE